MRINSEIRLRARHAVVPTIGLCLLVYFAYHAVQGDRGLKAQQQLSRQIAETRAALADVEARRATIERRVRLLRSDGLDLDMLDEQTREQLMLADPRDRIILE